MIILGVLLLLGAVGLSVAAYLANQDAFTTSAGTIELFGYQAEATVGQVFLVGAAAGAVTLIAFLMLFSGMGRNARRRSSTRRELNAQRQEVRELQRKNDEVASDLAAQRTSEDEVVVRDEARSSR